MDTSYFAPDANLCHASSIIPPSTHMEVFRLYLLLTEPNLSSGPTSGPTLDITSHGKPPPTLPIQTICIIELEHPTLPAIQLIQHYLQLCLLLSPLSLNTKQMEKGLNSISFIYKSQICAQCRRCAINAHWWKEYMNNHKSLRTNNGPLMGYEL